MSPDIGYGGAQFAGSYPANSLSWRLLNIFLVLRKHMKKPYGFVPVTQGNHHHISDATLIQKTYVAGSSFPLYYYFQVKNYRHGRLQGRIKYPVCQYMFCHTFIFVTGMQVTSLFPVNQVTGSCFSVFVDHGNGQVGIEGVLLEFAAYNGQ